MAHKYSRPGSPFWWMKTTARQPGRFSTLFHIGRKDETAKAEELEAKLTLEERAKKSVRHVSRFESWVDGFLTAHYSNEKTLQRMRAAWDIMLTYLHQCSVYGPEQVRREHCTAYLAWRLERGRRNAKGDKEGNATKELSRNTAILELKGLGAILSEAVNRGWLEHNVAYRLGIKRAPAKERAEMTDEHVQIIRAEIASRLNKAKNDAEIRNATYLNHSFEIAIAQGIRLSETRIHRSRVNLQDMEIQMHAKGGKEFFAPINPDIAPLFRKMIKEGRQWTYEMPDKNVPGLLWWQLFEKLRRAHPEMASVSYHSTRVRFVSRLERAGVPEAVVMKVVNHASTIVHRVYRKVKQGEMDAHWSALRATSEPPQNARRPKAARSSKSTSTPGPSSAPCPENETCGNADSKPASP